MSTCMHLWWTEGSFSRFRSVCCQLAAEFQGSHGCISLFNIVLYIFLDSVCTFLIIARKISKYSPDQLNFCHLFVSRSKTKQQQQQQ